MGEDEAGLWRRWRSTEITAESFHRLGDVSWDRGDCARKLEVRASRASAP